MQLIDLRESSAFTNRCFTRITWQILIYATRPFRDRTRENKLVKMNVCSRSLDKQIFKLNGDQLVNGMEREIELQAKYNCTVYLHACIIISFISFIVITIILQHSSFSESQLGNYRWGELKICFSYSFISISRQI